MNFRQQIAAILDYKSVTPMPVVHFGYWRETLEKWRQEGHITKEEAQSWDDSTPADFSIAKKLGFDFNWYNLFSTYTALFPYFETKVLETLSDGSQKIIDHNGVILLQKPGTNGIPPEIDHLLKTRREWEEYFLPRLQYCDDRILTAKVNTGHDFLPYTNGGFDYLSDNSRTLPMGLHCGSLFGNIRNLVGIEGASYIWMDDEPLFDEIINTCGELVYKCAEFALKSGAYFDFALFWEDICFKNGPLIVPSVFHEKVGPHYKRIAALIRGYGIEHICVDCDGLIDALIPTWIENGIDVMFPIEVGTWNASIEPWRKKYGKQLRGVGGVNKTVLAYDYAAIDAEVERLKPLVELGGYIPCFDHRIAPDAKWENVQYYCEQMRKYFNK